MNTPFISRPTIWFVLGCLVSLEVHASTSKIFALGLKGAESAALRTSNLFQAALSEEAASKSYMNAQFAALLPRLTLDGNYRYQSVIPAINFPMGPPGSPPQSIVLGSNNNYSIGPTVTYTVWDGWASHYSYSGANRSFESQEAAKDTTRQDVLTNVRVAYVRVQLAIEELRLTADTLKTAQVQNDDILKRFHAGAASRLDKITSHREMLNYELQFKQRQADLAQTLEDLIHQTSQQGEVEIPDTSSPYAPEVLEIELKDMAPPTLVVRVDSLSDALHAFERKTWDSPTPQHSRVRALDLASQATELGSKGIAGALWPTIQLSGRTSLDYPNGPIPEKINQNTVLATLTMPLFEWSRTRNLAGQKSAQAEAQRFRRDQTEIDLRRDWRKAMEELDSLKTQDRVSRQAVAEADEESRLSYETYKLGRLNLVDVEAVNLRALQAKVQSARITAQTLLQMIELISLSGKE